MKYQTVLLTLFFLIFCNAYSGIAQSEKTDFTNIVIKMEQKEEGGFIRGRVSPYLVSIHGNGTVTFDGMDEGKAVSRYEPWVKIYRQYKISKNQIKELAAEFERIGFFSLKDSYSSRDNGDGTRTVVRDGGLATVITSITINGKNKTVENFNFAPDKLIELQRKIYLAANLAQFIKIFPYWFSKFPDQMFPPRSKSKTETPNQSSFAKQEFRKIARKSPQNSKDGQIDVAKRWGFITPCVTNKTEVEKLLGKPIKTGNNPDLPVYNFKNEKIQIFYAKESNRNELCGKIVPDDTVVLFFVIPLKDLKLSDLNTDLKTFAKKDNYEGEIKSYINLAEGIRIETEVIQFNDKKQLEMITRITINRKILKDSVRSSVS